MITYIWDKSLTLIEGSLVALLLGALFGAAVGDWAGFIAFYTIYWWVLYRSVD